MHKDRAGKRYGGVAVYIANHLSFRRCQGYEFDDLETLWLKIHSKHSIFLLCTCYRPPDEGRDFWLNLQDSLDLAKQSGFNNLIITGDLNADPNTPNGTHLHNFCEGNNLTTHITEPTRITEHTATILDQFLTNIPDQVIETQILSPISTCDHCPITIELTFQTMKPRPFARLIWNYNDADEEGFRAELKALNWDECFVENKIDGAVEKWTSSFINTARQFIPNRVVTIRPQSKPFFTGSLRRLLRKKRRSHKLAKTYNTPFYWDKFKQIRNRYNDELRTAKSTYEAKLSTDLKNSNNVSPKKWWKIAKSFLKSPKKSSYPPLYHDNSDITDNKDKAKKFNDFFLSHSDINVQNIKLPEQNLPDGPMNLIHITDKDVQDQLKCIDPGKASGPDGIGSKMLKIAGDSIVPSLTRLFNLSLTLQQFPTSWKKANVTPIFKKEDPSDVNNYRPISLLSCLSKLFEKIVFKYIFNFLRDNNKISLKQSGFMPGDSTVYQLVHLYHLFCEALDNKKDIRITFCDISKAFDRVWHKGLLFKLKKTGISGPLLSWFESYLSYRQQRVVVGGEFSDWGHIKAGVPQGSVLGPLLFLIYINDITEVVNSEVRLFADDTILYVYVDNPVASAEALNSDLEQIDNWAKQWIIRFSPPKTESLTISRKKNKQPSPPLYFGGTPIREVSSHKHLGITFTNDLNWNKHLTQIANSAGKCVDVLNALKFKLDRKTLEKLYLSFVRSKLEYGNIIWDNCTQEQTDMLENVQLRAAKIVSGAIRRTHSELLYKELGWETLKEPRSKQRLTTMFKIYNNEAPTYLTSTLPNIVAENTPYNLRNRENLAGYKTRTKMYQLSFFSKNCK